ncbi:MAG TPA: aldo/keto reductase [Anaerolineae bacterium]|nr:aldo/keto reductase [Anaerolineae bacterium]
MRRIRLGRTGLMVSAVGFGGIPIQRLSDEQAVAMVRHCLNLGITFLDTANAYTTSEERIGRAISGRREGLVLATKTQARDAEGVTHHLQLSLERLGVRAIDLYQFHCVSSEVDYHKVIAPGGPLDVVKQAQREGQVGHVGLSSHSLEIALQAVKSGYFETIMFPFNFVASEAAQELIPLALAEDVGFIAMKPLAGGALNEARLAFKYLRQFPDILPIPGIERAEEIEEIVALMEGPAALSSEEQAAIQRMRAELGNRFCRRCGYCEPCPQGVPTQALMILDSMIKRMPPATVFSDFAQAVEKADACIECGECEQKCPYELPIREMIGEHVALFHSEMARHQRR